MGEILVPVDFSGASQRACDLAVELANVRGAELVLLHVVEPLPIFIVDEATSDALMKREAEALARFADLLRPHVKSLQTLLVPGTPWEQIRDVASARRVDLVVMGTHGRRGLARAVMGSVAERVVRTSPVPVMTVPGWAFASRHDAAQRLVTELLPLRLEAPMVVALSRGAVPLATEIARATKGTSDVWLVRAIAMDGNVVGAVTEEGDAVFDTQAPDRATEEDRRTAILAARRVLAEELMAIRGGRLIGDVWHRDVVLVDDGMVSPAAMQAAARSLRALLPRKLIAAVPLAHRDALAALTGRVDAVVCPEPMVAAVDASSWYRDDDIPTPGSARSAIDRDDVARIGSAAAR